MRVCTASGLPTPCQVAKSPPSNPEWPPSGPSVRGGLPLAFSCFCLPLAPRTCRAFAQAFPELTISEIAYGLSSVPYGGFEVLHGLPQQLWVAVVTTLITLPVKVLLLLMSLHLFCLPFVAEQQNFRFELSDESGEPSSSGSAAMLIVEGDAPETRAERRRVMRVMEGQLTEAKRVVTLSFLGFLLTTAIGAVRLLDALGSMEPFVFTMLAAYGCLRHSKICQSQPERCRAVVANAAVLLLPIAAAGALQVVLSADSRSQWAQARRVHPPNPPAIRRITHWTCHPSSARGFPDIVCLTAQAFLTTTALCRRVCWVELLWCRWPLTSFSSFCSSVHYCGCLCISPLYARITLYRVVARSIGSAICFEASRTRASPLVASSVPRGVTRTFLSLHSRSSQ